MKLVIAMRSASRASIWSWPAWATERLRALFPEVEILEFERPIDGGWDGDPTDVALFADADAVVAWRLDPGLWRAAKRLRWIHCPSAAVHQLLTPELVASAIAVTNGASVHAATVAEHALALMLALGRGIPLAVRQQAESRWDGAAIASGVAELDGSTVVIAGMGHIGRALAPKLEALGARVLGVGRAQAPTLASRLEAADWLVLALPVTPETQSLIGPAHLAALPRGARLVNVGRGAALREEALLDALRSGHLAAAALDVFEHEPLAADSPLWTCPNLLITPHIAAAAAPTWHRQLDLIARHLRQFAAGEQPQPQVVKARGY